MTVPFETIRKTLTARMKEFSGIDQARIEYPSAEYPNGGVFKPPEDGVWCAFNIQPAASFFAGMAEKPHYRRPGQVVIQCFTRKRIGMGPINRLADAISDHFQSWPSGHIECMEVSQQDVGDFKDYYQINVNIRYRAG